MTDSAAQFGTPGDRPILRPHSSGRVYCLVPGCGCSQRADQGLWPEYICWKHWRGVPLALRRRRTNIVMLARRYGWLVDLMEEQYGTWKMAVSAALSSAATIPDAPI